METNLMTCARTSFTAVRDRKKFEEWTETVPGLETVSVKKGEHGIMYALIFKEGIPTLKSDENGAWDYNIYAEIQNHLAAGWSITFHEVEACTEGRRYLQGYAAVVTANDVQQIDLYEWAHAKRKQMKVEGTDASLFSVT